MRTVECPKCKTVWEIDIPNKEWDNERVAKYIKCETCGEMLAVSATQIRVVKDMKNPKIIKLKNIIKDFPMRKEELVEILMDLEEKGLITGVGKDKIKMSPNAIQLLDNLRYNWNERNTDVV